MKGGAKVDILAQTGLVVHHPHEVGDVVGVAVTLEAEVLTHLQIQEVHGHCRLSRRRSTVARKTRAEATTRT